MKPVYYLLLACACAAFQASANMVTEIEKRGACPMHYVTGPGDVCFRFAEDYKTFGQARQQCETEGAELVKTQSNAVYRFVKQHIESNPKRPKIVKVFGKISKIFTKWSRGWWVGAHKNGHDFRWLDGKPAYGHWMSGMPDNGRLFLVNWVQENCVEQLESWHGWNDAACDTKLRFICQKKPANPCAKVNCGGHGKCAVTGNKGICRCAEGWTGQNCQKPVDPCSPNPCLNGGKCFANSLGTHCSCVGQFSGSRCEKKCRFVVTSEGLPRKADVLVLLDGSTSVRELDYRKSLGFVAKFVDKLEIGAAAARVGLIQFSHIWETEFSLADSVKMGEYALKSKVLGLTQLTGGTATGKVLEKAKNVLHQDTRVYTPHVATFVLLITDGQSHQENIIRVVVPQILGMGVKILTVGVGPAVDAAELLLLTGGHANRVFSVDSFDKLDNEFLQTIIERMCD